MATYTIIGSDQKQYGSVTVDDVYKWIAEGRLSEQSLIKAPGEAEFRPLTDFTEFAEALAAKAASAIEPPPLSAKPTSPAKKSGLAIASLVLGILGIISCGATALIGLILGIIALVKVKNSRGALAGRGLALAGIIVSAIFLLLLPIFAALLLPALRSAIPRAQTINCMNNVRQLAAAMRIYAGDNRNHFPSATNWCDALQSKVAMTNVFRCPADNSNGRCGYAFNARLSGVAESQVNPTTVMLFEADSGWNASGGKELLPAKPRHYKEVMVVGFADGHVEEVPESRLSQLRWDP